MIFKDELDKRAREIDKVLDTYLPEETGFQKNVISAMNYSVHSGGKRLRPMLMLETYRIFSGRTRAIEPFMAAIEMIHTYSLIHDDLPAMDNDEYRRGRKTVHVVYGEAQAILAGDALLNYAFETALSAFDIDKGCPGIPRSLKTLAEKSGIYGMIGGQTIDVSYEGKPMDLELLQTMYSWKTGALIEAAMMIGAILAGASDEDISLIEAVAVDVGLAFQIQDDILDVTSTQEALGKPVGSDERNNKTTYAALLGISESSNEVRRLTENAMAKLERITKDACFLEQLLTWLIQRKN